MAGRLNKVQEIEREVRGLPTCERCHAGRATNIIKERRLCDSCQADLRHEESKAFCDRMGLRTIDEMREFCRQRARTFGRGISFEQWSKTITQRTVDIIAVTGGRSDEQCLERLRAVGAIDGRNKLIPLEGRQVAADAHRAERARLICETEAELERRAASTEAGI